MFEGEILLGDVERCIRFDTHLGIPIPNSIGPEPDEKARQFHERIRKKFGSKWINRKPLDATTVDLSLFTCTGLAIGSDKIYLAKNGAGEVFRTSQTPDSHSGDLLSGNQFTSGGGWLSDMACDPNTFAPSEVIWVRSSLSCTPEADPFCDPANDLITAYEIEPGGCGAGPSIGACCDPNLAPCRDVPQSQCQGATEVWTEGVLCSDLVPPCHEMHRIILRDRTGSMQASFDESTTRCERARQTAISDVMSFFTQNPVGSSVAVWTFTGAETSPLTPGFMDEATSTLKMNRELDSIRVSAHFHKSQRHNRLSSRMGCGLKRE